MSAILKRRSAKTTRSQYLIYLAELEHNEALKTNKVSPKNPNIISETWDKLTKELNCSGGPHKNTESWKKIFADWKCSVKRKARLIKLSQTETGGGSPDKPLTDIEEKLIALLGRVVIDGLTDVPEVGLRGVETSVTITDESNNSEDCNEDMEVGPSTRLLAGGDESGDNIDKHQYSNRKFIAQHRTMKAEAQKNQFLRAKKFNMHNRTMRINVPTPIPKNKTLLNTVQEFITHAKDSNVNNSLMEINESLKELVALKKKEVEMLSVRLELDYPNVIIQQQSVIHSNK